MTVTPPRTGDPDGPRGDGDSPPPDRVAEAPPAGRRPLVERLGLAFIALVLVVLFGGMAVASWAGGELFLAIMAAIGALMTAWAGAITLFRG